MTASHLIYDYMTNSQLSASPQKRARHETQKQERRETILNTAQGLFLAATYDAVTMDGIARETGLAKGTLFLYFRTKEELFLALTVRELTAWFGRVDALLAELPCPASTESVADALADSVSQQVGFARLMAILSTVLEQNISYEAALTFKQSLLAQMASTGARLERCLEFLPRNEGGIRLLMQCQALLVGIWHLADPAPVIREVLQRPEMGVFSVDFEREFRQTLLSLLKGIERIQVTR